MNEIALLLVLVLAVVWLVCGVLAYGFMLAFLQREFPRLAKRDYKCDRRFAMIDFCLGPIGLLACFLSNGSVHGLMFRSPREPIVVDFLIPPKKKRLK